MRARMSMVPIVRNSTDSSPDSCSAKVNKPGGGVHLSEADGRASDRHQEQGDIGGHSRTFRLTP
jgi:hypothetical protein